jgi:hypothetical protein
MAKRNLSLVDDGIEGPSAERRRGKYTFRRHAITARRAIEASRSLHLADLNHDPMATTS